MYGDCVPEICEGPFCCLGQCAIEGTRLRMGVDDIDMQDGMLPF